MSNLTKSSLVDQIIKNPQSFDLMQSISLLERDAVSNGFSQVGVKDNRPEAISSVASYGFVRYWWCNA